MKRALLVLAGGLIGGALAPYAVQAGVESYRLIQAGGWTATAASALSMATYAINFGTDPADTGDVNLENATSVCWESSPAGTDVCMSVSTGEAFTFTNGISITSIGTWDSTDGIQVTSGTGDVSLVAGNRFNVEGAAGDSYITRLSSAMWLVDDGVAFMTGDGNDVDFGDDVILDEIDEDLTSTCTAGWLKVDTATTPELCYCAATDTWYCVSFTDLTGPND